ncbi:MAG: chemotaxis response regulator protein-glutamate methylesterase [Gammaproteobacteria bacterium]
MSNKIKVLIVDDSALVRKILQNGLSKDPDIEVIGTARDPYIARDLLVEHQPDVITLDVEMPRMDGVTFLRKFMPTFPTPTIMVSSLTEKGKRITIEALEAGAIDIIEKPKVGVADELPLMMDDICERVKAAARAKVRARMVAKSRQTSTTADPDIEDVSKALDHSTDQVIAIGASTGGVEALARILPMFPAATPGIVIVQHMPGGFTHSFAQRLDSICTLQVKEAEDGDRIRAGRALLAPGGNRHMEVYRAGGEYRVRLVEGPKVSSHQPSVDVLFDSVAKNVGKNATAVLMTGMGKDGANGLKKLRDVGCHTFAQDEQSCVVYGMPKAAWDIGAAEYQVSLDKIPVQVLSALRR